jgi:hypothetical protein
MQVNVYMTMAYYKNWHERVMLSGSEASAWATPPAW